MQAWRKCGESMGEIVTVMQRYGVDRGRTLDLFLHMQKVCA
jgi:hypothetical protein